MNRFPDGYFEQFAATIVEMKEAHLRRHQRIHELGDKLGSGGGWSEEEITEFYRLSDECKQAAKQIEHMEEEHMRLSVGHLIDA